MRLFIIPGNPPALHFYQLWAEEIQREYPGSSVRISPYPLLEHSASSLEYLQETAAIHGQELLAFHQADQEKVVLIGHSVGAWMALRLLEEQSAVIEHCLLLYPFLQRPTFKGRAKLQTARFLYRLPFQLLLAARRLLERVFGDLKHVTEKEMRIALSLAYHEYPVIGCNKKTLHIRDDLQGKLSMIYCDGDKWCPPRTTQEMKELIPCEKVSATHGFITSKEERLIVLKALRKYL